MNKVVMVVVALAGLAGVARADFVEGFEPPFNGTGWDFHNQSNPIGLADAYGLTNNASFVHSGTQALGVTYQAGSGVSTLSDWAILPTQTLNDGDTFSFWSEAPFNNIYPDRLQVRLSINGASANTGATEFDVGDFTTLLLDINPNYTTTDFPLTYTQFSMTLAGLGGPVTGRLAFRYFVENGGPAGANSDVVFLDDLAYTSVPAPSALALLGVAGLAAGRRRR
jgi:MYXO-CTERM domain-containing protein